jgi:hypothetical protein
MEGTRTVAIKKIVLLLVGMVMALAVAGVAGAEITFNPLTGTGFVGKGDVQTAFGWNNATLQTNAGGLEFSFEQTIDEQHQCQGLTATRTGTYSGKLGYTMTYETRAGKQQVTGFYLTGIQTLFVPDVVYSPAPYGQTAAGIAYWACVAVNGQTTVYNDTGPFVLYVTSNLDDWTVALPYTIP